MYGAPVSYCSRVHHQIVVGYNLYTPPDQPFAYSSPNKDSSPPIPPLPLPFPLSPTLLPKPSQINFQSIPIQLHLSRDSGPPYS